MKGLHFIFGIIFSIQISGCGNQIQDFVNTAAKPLDSRNPSKGAAHKGKIKISPGAQHVKGTQVDSYLAITTTKKTLVGSKVQADISFHQKR